MIQRILSFAVILLFLANCDEEPDPREFPVIRTLSPADINSAGATFRGETVQEGNTKTTSYGFIWSLKEPDINTSEKIILGSELPEGIFQTRINFSLERGFEYKIRTFATYGDKTVYGNIVTLLSKGSEESVWSKEISGIRLYGWNIPYGWSDGENGYVIFQNAVVYKFNPATKSFTRLADFPVTGNSGTAYTAVGSAGIQYVFSDIDKKLYQLADGTWSVNSNTPFYYGYFGGYYHGYFAANQIFLLSSIQSYSYDPGTKLWQTRSKMSTINFSVGGTDHDGYAYVMDCQKRIQKYDPQEDKWQYITTFPGSFPPSSDYPFYGKIIGFSHNGRIYFGFSFEDNRTAEWIGKSIWSFDLISNTWEQVKTFPEDLNPGQVFHFSIKGKLYIGHGESGLFNIYSLNMSEL